MLAQIALEFRSLPDLYTMPIHVIRFWYEMLRPGLEKRSAQAREIEALIKNKKG